jgi:hypothetical protein
MFDLFTDFFCYQYPNQYMLEASPFSMEKCRHDTMHIQILIDCFQYTERGNLKKERRIGICIYFVAGMRNE